MARYYGRRWSGRNWGAYHVSQRQQLTNMFAGIDKDIQKIGSTAIYVMPKPVNRNQCGE